MTGYEMANYLSGLARVAREEAAKIEEWRINAIARRMERDEDQDAMMAWQNRRNAEQMEKVVKLMRMRMDNETTQPDAKLPK